MSLILEALKKLERDKQVPERGFLVVGAGVWPARTRGPFWIKLAAVAIGFAAALVAFATWSARPRATSAARPAVAPAPLSAERPSSVLATRPQTVPAPVALPTAPPQSSSQRTAATPAKSVATATTTPAPEPSPASAPAYALQAISVQDGEPVAVINERIMREGDSFNGLRVVRIGETEVEVEVQGKKTVLRF
jgi:hypothetical protein